MTEAEYFNVLKSKGDIQETRIYHLDKPATGKIINGDRFHIVVAMDDIGLNITYNHIEAREYLNIKDMEVKDNGEG